MSTNKPIALLAIVADNRMIGNVDDSPLPFDLPTGSAWIFHVMSGADPTNAEPLKHSFVFGRRVYEEFMGYGIMPVGGGVNVVISSTLAADDGSPRPLPATTDPGAPDNPRIVAVGSVEQALEVGTAPEADPRAGELCLVLGGERIYTDTLEKASFLRMFHMRTEFEGGILFPEYDAGAWVPIWHTDPDTEKNEVDGEIVAYQVIDSVRASEADSSDLAPVVEAIIAVNEAFTHR